jgi:transposase
MPFALIGQIFQISGETIDKQVKKYQQRDPDDGWQLARGRPPLLTLAQYTRLKERTINSYHKCRP